MVSNLTPRTSFRHLFAVPFTCLLLAAAFTPKLSAGVLITSFNTGMMGGDSTNKGSQIGQQFILNLAESVTSVDLALESPGGVNLTSLSLQIFSDSLGNPGALVPGATDTAVSGTLSTNFSDILFSFSGVSLNPGTYWLILANSASPSLTWQTQTTLQSNSNAIGRITNVVFFSSTTTSGTPSLLATVNGPAIVVPEPSTILFSVSALFAMLGFRRHFRTINTR
jgi:hypothetical protein